MEPDRQPIDDSEQLLQLDFGRYFSALRKYAWLVIALIALAITGAVVYTNRLPKIYEAKASVQIEPRLPDLLGQGQEILASGGMGGTADYYKQQKQVLGSYKLIRQTVEGNQLHLKMLSERARADRKLEDQLDEATRLLQESMTIKYPDQDRIMYVVVRSDDAPFAAKIANLHVDTFVQYSRGLLSTDTRQASDALSAEFDDAEKKLRDAEAALYAFQKENDLLAVSLEDRQSLTSSNITSYTAKRNEARARRIEIGSRLTRMKKLAGFDVLQSPILLLGEQASFEALRAQYYAERNKFIEIEKQFGPKHSEHQMQKAKVDDLYGALTTEAKRLVAGLEEQHQAALGTEAALQAEVDTFTKEALELGPKIVAYNELVRKRKSVEDRYNILRTRLSASELSGRVTGKIEATNVKPLDPALVPTEPVSPRLRVNVAGAGIVSLVLGLALVLLIVFLDRSVKNVADAQQATGVPVLGVVPMIEDLGEGREDDRKRDLYVHEHPASPVAECCRSLRTNILFSAADRQLKTIVVSSANPREGKTTCVIYLGTTMAQSGQRVLLIDTDMRKPRLHSLTGGSRAVGLSNLILGDRDYDEVIRSTDVPNLSVLPCGPLPPNPAELLMGSRFQKILAELNERFDRIILDSPPLQPVTDAVLLSKQTDGVILVVQAGRTLREDIKRSANKIRGVGGAIFGVIVNAIEAGDRDGYYYSYEGYGTPEDTKAQGSAA
ncbi:MAG TPA: polysaccharide biosynthesis tyrosine autokinase [Kofleriaceae bacterium]|nr:polysaccharide biosynthesis tyrosine autokinase [Kofleriaceae bacterium]